MSMQFWQMSFGAGIAVSTALLVGLAVWHSLCKLVIALIENAPVTENDYLSTAIHAELPPD